MRVALLSLSALILPALVLAAPRAPRPSATTAPAVPALSLPWPGDSRAALEIPAEAWRSVTATGALPPGPLGYTFEQMRNYGRDRAQMRTVETLFRDARGVPRFAGRVTDDLLAAADPAKPQVAEMVRQSFVLTDVASARMYPGPAADSWGVPWIPPDAPSSIALELAWRRAAPSKAPAREGAGAQDAELGALLSLPEPVQRFVARVLVGADAALPWLDLAYEKADLRDAGARGFDAALALASAPWTDEENDQVATRSRASFDLLTDVDREYLAYGSVIFLLHAGLGLEELRAWAATDAGRQALAATAGMRIQATTRFGSVRIAGAGGDVHASPGFLSLDLGGNDSWRGRHGANAAPLGRIALAVDLSGDDSWDGGESACALGCGLFGLGAVLDASGDDTWRVTESGLGAGWFGTGVVADFAGNDSWIVKEGWAQGAAHAGVGVLADLAGDDAYECAQQSQGLGSTLGAGVLIDVSGNDRYVARDDGNVSPLYLNQSVAMAQGCGYGRRADLGDGHSLAGGVGVLLDGAGDDLYHAQVWAQGAGYWWALGILEDRGGNDTYENGKYSLGAAAHFAIGSFVDLAGDDRYNVGIEGAVNQYHAHARDGSIGVAIDGDGNDEYFFRSHCGGSGDLGSVGFFWDRRGDDEYVVAMKEVTEPNGWNETPPMGSSTWYAPYRSWRDELPTVGVFLDTGGRDAHSETSPGRNDATWTRPHAPASHGLGIDADWYPPADRQARSPLSDSTSAPR